MKNQELLSLYNTKILSCNVNGIRAAIKKGFWEFVFEQDPDILCLQETRCFAKDIPDLNRLETYQKFFKESILPGYSGVALFTKTTPIAVTYDFDRDWIDKEGRIVMAEYENYSVLSVYFPSGSSSEERQERKFQFLKYFTQLLKELKTKGKPIILCGDINIAHQKLDIKNWKSNQKSSGFLPEERDWMTMILNEFQLMDSFRYLHPTLEEYTWWSARAGAYHNNVGWRIDYQLVSQELQDSIYKMQIFRTPRFSDHAAVIGYYNFSNKKEKMIL